MITDTLQTYLTAAGCTFVKYESDQLANITLDGANQNSIIGIVIEPSLVNLIVSGNGVNTQYPIYVEILKQVKPEDTAENNKIAMDSLLIIAKDFIYRLIVSGLYKKILNVPATKINERKYDANVMGWSLALTLNPIENKTNC